MTDRLIDLEYLERLIDRAENLLRSYEEIKHDWYCGCGHWNGTNLPICAMCGRKPNGEMP